MEIHLKQFTVSGNFKSIIYISNTTKDNYLFGYTEIKDEDFYPPKDNRDWTSCDWEDKDDYCDFRRDLFNMLEDWNYWD